MEIKYKGIPLKPVKQFSIPEHEGLGKYLISMVWPLGDAKIVGSFTKRVSYHDIDVCILSDIKTQKTFVKYIREKVIPRWRDVASINIDFFVYGDFEREVFQDRYFKIFFNSVENRKWEVLGTKTRKFFRSLFQ